MRSLIIARLAENPQAEFNPKELFRQMGLPRRRFDEYRQAVSDLLNGGQIVKSGIHRLTAKKSAPAVWGILRLTPHGYGFIDRDDGNSIFISAREAEKAHDRDYVQVELHDRGHEAGPEGVIVEVDRSKRLPLLGKIFRGDQDWLAQIRSGPVMFSAVIKNAADFERLRDDDWALFRVASGRRRWPLPEARIEIMLGSPRKKGVAEKGLLASFGFVEGYPPEALQEAKSLGSEKAVKGVRRDLRDEFIVTIDPADARDHDDAVSLQRQKAGYDLFVHISDVSRFVRESSAIDREARSRAFSVYLLHHHLPMLPPRLPGELCSLKPGRDRQSLTVRIRFDEAGAIVKQEVFPAKIRVQRLLSYEEAQEFIDKPRGKKAKSDPALAGALSDMWELASKLRRKRLAEGGVDFDLPEAGFHWDDGAAPTSIMRQSRLPSHQLIEEFMLAANRAVAQLWAEKFGAETANIFRVHPPLDAGKRQKLVEYLSDAGFQWPAGKLTTAHQIGELIDQARRRFPTEVVSVIVRKALTLAKYDPASLGHFGLGFQHYLHFTSPIRRYADLTVHRLIWEYLIGTADKENAHNGSDHEEKLQALCRHLSQRERLIAELEREANKLAGLLYLEEHRDEVFPARLVEVYQDKFFIALENLYLEGVLIPTPTSPIRFRSGRDRQAGRARPSTTGRRRQLRPRQEGIGIGDHLDVCISRIDLLNRKLELKLT